MNKRLRAIAIAIGYTTLSLAWLVEPLINPRHDTIYHWNGGVSALFGPVAVMVLLLWAFVVLALLKAQRPGLWRTMVWAALLLTVPTAIIRDARLIWPNVLPAWLIPPRMWLMAAAWLLLFILWWRFPSKRGEHVIDFASTVLSFTALSGLLFMGQLLWCWWQARGLNASLPPRSELRATGTASQNPRIIWIMLDELSYQQVYEHRYPNLALPAFDSLAAESTVFTHVIPTANFTEMAIPALLSGTTIDNVRSTARGQLLVHSKGSGWKPFDERNTVFQDAVDSGYPTDLVGWYNPYCRLLPTVLDRCYWTDDYTDSNGLVADGTFGSNLLTPVSSMVARHDSLRHFLDRIFGIQVEGSNPGRLHILDYQNLSKAGETALLDRSARLTFLHLPIPHPGGIYNRETASLTTGPSTYMDNLALADSYLTQVRSLLEKTGQWDSSTVIVMGDHGWRTSLIWKTLPSWTSEEEKASAGGKFDDRPTYIVKLAGQRTNERVNHPLKAIKTRKLVDALMKREIQTPADLESWVAQTD
jgi:hypothetical protein